MHPLLLAGNRVGGHAVDMREHVRRGRAEVAQPPTTIELGEDKILRPAMRDHRRHPNGTHQREASACVRHSLDVPMRQRHRQAVEVRDAERHVVKGLGHLAGVQPPPWRSYLPDLRARHQQLGK